MSGRGWSSYRVRLQYLPLRKMGSHADVKAQDAALKFKIAASWLQFRIMLRFFFEASCLTATLAVLLNKSICAVCFFCGRILLRSPYAANNLRMHDQAVDDK